MKDCPTCGSQFVPIRQQAYCSRRCQGRAAARRAKGQPEADILNQQSCRVCGVPIQGKIRTAQYCSISCKDKAQHRREAGLPEKTPKKRCQTCGVPISGNLRKLYCSQECNEASARARYQAAVYGSPIPDPLMQTKDRYRRARALGYRSGLEVRTAKDLEARGVEFAYEPFKVPFVEPAKKRTYTPDFILWHNGIVIDTKGRWETSDRQKFKMIREQHPELDLRLVFSNPLSRIGKKSPTTYAMYATKIGCPFTKESIPQEWIDEPVNEASLAICRELFT